MKATLAAVRASNLNAISYIDEEGALARAAQADVSKPFGGVPIGVKELDSVEGWPDTHASVPLRNQVAGHTSIMVQRLRDLGNTVLVVEHDEDTIRESDWIVDIGPGAGEHGGEVVYSGPVKGILKSKDSITGQYLSGRRSIPVPATRRAPGADWIEIVGAREHNLKALNVDIPRGKFSVITGVSGSGKSTLARRLAERLGDAYVDSGAMYRTLSALLPGVDAGLLTNLSLGGLFVAFVIAQSRRVRDGRSLLEATAWISVAYLLLARGINYPWYSVLPIALMALTGRLPLIALMGVLTIAARAAAPLIDLHPEVYPFPDAAAIALSLGSFVSFGVFGFLPLWLARRWTLELAAMGTRPAAA